MRKYIFKKIINILVVLIGVTFLTFMMGRLAPGDPARTLLEKENVEPTSEELKEAREYLGLDAPLLTQYKNYIVNLMKGDLGKSYRNGKSVLYEIGNRLPATITLAIIAMVILIVISIPIGLYLGLSNNKILMKLSNTVIFVIMSMPTFAIGIFLVILFGIKFKILPVEGADKIESIILPATTLALGMCGSLIWFIRGEVIEEKEKDYVYAARGFGISKIKIITNLILRNIMVPVITRFGLIFGGLLGGSVIIENIFSWPGTGSLLIEAIQGRDYPIIQGYALLMAIIYVVINWLIDFSYVFIDPRILNGEKI